MATWTTSTEQNESTGRASTSSRSYTESESGQLAGITSPREAVSRAGFGSESGHATAEFDMSHRVGLWKEIIQSVTGLEPECVGTGPREKVLDRPATGDLAKDPTGAYIPQGDFRRVWGRVVDTGGEPITEARWLVAQDALSTAARVNDDAYFEINLLRVDYENFALLVDSPEPDMNYVWYTAVDYVLEPGMNAVTIVFKRAQPEGGGGLFAGTGVSMG